MSDDERHGNTSLEERWLPSATASAAARAAPASSPPSQSHEATARPAAASRRKGIRVPTWLAGVLLLVLLAAVAVAAFAVLSREDRAPTTIVRAGSPPPAALSSARPVRDPFEVGGVRWAVFANPSQPWTRFTKRNDAGVGRTWLTVTVRARNLSRPGLKLLRLPFVLTGPRGTAYGAEARFGSGPRVARGAPEVKVGETDQVQLAYKVPESVRAFRLNFASRSFGGQPITVAVPAR